MSKPETQTVRSKLENALEFAYRQGFCVATDPAIADVSTWSVGAEADRLCDLFAAKHAHPEAQAPSDLQALEARVSALEERCVAVPAATIQDWITQAHQSAVQTATRPKP